MKAPRAQGKNLKIEAPRGLGGTPNFFSLTPNLIFFVTINSVQNFKPSRRKVCVGGWVVGWVGGGGV